MLRLVGILLLCALLPASPRAEELTLFAGTQYPLSVHILEGPEPGPTVMVQGGVQGDEPSGFLTAECLARATVQRGRLIVIPRANLPSILQRARQINVDLNRRFDKDYNEYYEDHLARAIRFFVDQADAFVHLHEGSGFYAPTHVDALRNPRRYGQSVIIDAPVHVGGKGRLKLAEEVAKVLERVNREVTPEKWRFALFSTDTFSDKSPHLEQRKSLTFYALQHNSIPAVAVEVSKDIADLGWKVRQQLKVTLAFLEHFGLRLAVPDPGGVLRRQPPPPLLVGQTRLDSARQPAVALSPNAALRLSLAGMLDSGPAYGVFASDRPGQNLLTSPRLADKPFDRLEVRSDGRVAARLPVQWRGSWPRGEAGERPHFVLWLNGELRVVPAGETLPAVAGDQLLLEGIRGSAPRQEEVLNLKGVVAGSGGPGGPGANQDIGVELILDPALFLPGYLKPGSQPGEWLARVARETRGETPAEFFIRIAPRTLTALLLADAQGRPAEVPWTAGRKATLPPGSYILQNAASNGPRDKLVIVAGATPLAWGKTLRVEPGQNLTIAARQATTFTPLGHMTLSAGSSQASLEVGALPPALRRRK